MMASLAGDESFVFRYLRHAHKATKAGGEQVTLAIVFTDVVGSTALNEELRDEATNTGRGALALVQQLPDGGPPFDQEFPYLGTMPG
jgi:hypothetical protein